jgi:uncharacterized membrane protein YqjE
MALLQALLAFVGRSAGKILNAVFGWSVRALFGTTTGAQQTLLTGVVALAALWPLLLAGIVAPRAAAFLLAFVPIPQSVPAWTVRLVWIALAVLVPTVVGIALATKQPPDAPRESMIVRLARGYPITFGLSVAFWISFVSVPVVHVATIVRGRADVHVPVITDADGYRDMAARIHGTLAAHGFPLAPVTPPWWVTAPMRVLRATGGAALRAYVPGRLEYFVGPTLDVTVHPNSLLLRGEPQRLAYAQGLVVESLTPTPAVQTTTPEAQSLERQIRRVWTALEENPKAHTRSPWLRSRLDDIVREIAALQTSYEEWQVVYRQALQLGRALDGEPQLLTRHTQGGTMMNQTTENAKAPHPTGWERRSTAELVREVASKATTLVSKEVELARVELKNDFASELATVKSFAVAAVAAMLMLDALLLAGVFALVPYIDLRLAALAIAGVFLVIALVAAAVGWRHHVTKPLARTRKTVEEDVQWAKEQLA